MKMKELMKKRNIKQRMLGCLAAGLALAMILGLLTGLTGGTLADPLGYRVIDNYDYDPPDPFPPIFGPDLTAWTRFQDHPGYDSAFTRDRSRAFTGETSPNHIYIGSNALVFFGYESGAKLDYIFTEEYKVDGPDDHRFTSISFALRPVDLSFHALSQSGFLFNGIFNDVTKLYSGYMIALEAHDDGLGGRVADLRLYYVENVPMDDDNIVGFEDLSKRTLISTYATGISAADVWPVYVRIEADNTNEKLQVFIDGQLRTRDLEFFDEAGGSAFGFFTSYIGHDCDELTVTAYSNLRIEAPFVTVPATATVRFVDIDTDEELADEQTTLGQAVGLWAGMHGGQTGQYYYINPPSFPGYYLIETNQKNLDSIPYFALDDYNITTLYYRNHEESYKESSTMVDIPVGEPPVMTPTLVQDNGTDKNPVHVDVNDIIDYKVFGKSRDDINPTYGQWVVEDWKGNKRSNVNMSTFGGERIGSTSGQPLITRVNPDPVPGKSNVFWWYDVYNDVVNSAKQNKGWNSSKAQDIVIGTDATSRGGEMTATSNYTMVLGAATAEQATTANDETVIGFLLPVANKKFADANIVTGAGNDIKYTPVCTNHNAVANLANHYTNHTACPFCDERYIKLTYNKLRLDSGYVIDLLLNLSGGAPADSYYFRVEGRDSKGGAVDRTFYRNPFGSGNLGNSVHAVACNNMFPNESGVPAEHVDPYETDPAFPNGVPFVYPNADGTVSLTVKRVHNANHDYNIWIGAGQVRERRRVAVMTIVDTLPAGVEYVDGSSGPYEGNLTKTPGPNGTTILTWDFGMVPPEGITIDFQGKVISEGYFENKAAINYYNGTGPASSTTLISSQETNHTYHQTGDPVGVIERFFMLGGGPAKLQPDRFIGMHPNDPYTISLISMGDIIDPDTGDVWRFVGWRYPGNDANNTPYTPGEPPGNVINQVKGGEKVDLIFAKNPKVTVKFVDIDNPLGPELKDEELYRLAYQDPFFLDGSRMEPIPGSPQNYYYVAYSKDGGSTPPVSGAPGKPVYDCVETDEEIILYFRQSYAVTVHYAEYGNPSNMLHDDDYYTQNQTSGLPLAWNDAFDVQQVTPGELYLERIDTTYGYVGWSVPEEDVNGEPIVHDGPPPDDLLINPGDREITLYYATIYNITVKYHLDEPYFEGKVYAELLPVESMTVQAGTDLGTLTAPDTITYNGVVYRKVPCFKWTGDDQPLNPGDPAIGKVYRDYTVIFLYEPTNDPPSGDVTVLVKHREYHNELEPLVVPDKEYTYPIGGSFIPGALSPNPEPQAIPNWTYIGYILDGAEHLGQQPPTIPNLQGNHTLTLLYTQGVVEQFRELDNESNYMKPNTVAKLLGGVYTPGFGTPPAEFYVDEDHVYAFRGYRVGDEDQPIVYCTAAEAYQISPNMPNGEKITYLYENTKMFIVTEEFRLWDDPAFSLLPDNKVHVLLHEDYIRGEMPPDKIIVVDPVTETEVVYYYKGYMITPGKVPTEGGAEERPFTNVIANGSVITYLYGERANWVLHIRQMVIGPMPPDLEQPLVGYFRLTDGDEMMMYATGYSGLLNSYVTGYSDYFLPVVDSGAFNVYDFIPQYYEFAGHYQNYGDAALTAGHDELVGLVSPGSKANGMIELNYGSEGEIWLTVYITPKGAPGSYTWSYATNDFGKVSLPPGP